MLSKSVFVSCFVLLSTAFVEAVSIQNQDIGCPFPVSIFSVLIPNPNDCHSFYICDNGRPTLIQCPSKLCFNPNYGEEGGACDHCRKVPGCEDSTRRPTSVAPTSARPDTSGPPSTTTSAQPETTAPPRTTAQPETPAPSTARTTTEQSGGDDLPCPSDIPYVYLPYPGNCNQFYYCVDGINTGTWNCGEGLWFMYKEQACTHPWGSSCQ